MCVLCTGASHTTTTKTIAHWHFRLRCNEYRLLLYYNRFSIGMMRLRSATNREIDRKWKIKKNKERSYHSHYYYTRRRHITGNGNDICMHIVSVAVHLWSRTMLYRVFPCRVRSEHKTKHTAQHTHTANQMQEDKKKEKKQTSKKNSKARKKDCVV